jgi:hypothetical protein
MEKIEDAVLGMDIYRLERNGAREIAGSDLEDVSTGDGIGTTSHSPHPTPHSPATRLSLPPGVPCAVVRIM